MRDGQCPKCGSYQVYSGADLTWKGGRDTGNAIPVGAGVFRSSTAILDSYVCVNCGYVESYISDPKSLEDIARTWPRVIDTLQE